MLIHKSKISAFVLAGCMSLPGVWFVWPSAFANHNSDEHIAIQSAVNNVVESYNRYQYEEDDVLKTRLTPIVKDMVDLNTLAPQIIQKQWPDLNTYEQVQFTEAMAAAIASHIVDYLRSAQGRIDLKLDGIEQKQNLTILDYGLENKTLVAYLFKDDYGKWKLRDVKVGKLSILQYYYSVCKKLIDRYALAYTIAELTQSNHIVLENFESSAVGELPFRWGWKDNDEDRPKPYRVQQEPGNKYLAATDEGESVILGKDIKWNLHEYPYVSFKWRGHHLPVGGDERFGKTVDSAAGVYFTVKMKFGLIPESIKYVWSSSLPVGSAMRRSGIGRPWMVIAESGKDHLGEWRTYVFNLYEAYKATFGGEPPEVAAGIGILSDANSTNSKAYADYDDILALKQVAAANPGVSQILDAE